MWNNKIPLIKYSTIIGNKDSGGLNIQYIYLKKVAFPIKLLNKYFNSDFKAVWRHTMSEFLGRYMEMKLTHNIVNIVFNESDLTNINPFYAEVLRAWDYVTKRKRFLSIYLNDILSQTLFHNPSITYNSKVLSFISFIESGIVTVADIAYEVVPGFLLVSAIVEIVKDKYPNMAKTEIVLAYNIILKALPDEGKKKF